MEEGILTWDEYLEKSDSMRVECFRCNENLEGQNVYLGRDSEAYCEEFCYRRRILEDAAPMLLETCKEILSTLYTRNKQSRNFESEIQSLEKAIGIAETDQNEVKEI